jgi:hypothetical protein
MLIYNVLIHYMINLDQEIWGISYWQYADKAQDNLRSFNLWDNLNIESAIQIRKNASIKTKGYPLRRDKMLLIRKIWYKGMEAAKRYRKTMDSRHCLFLIKKSIRRWPTFQGIQNRKGRSETWDYAGNKFTLRMIHDMPLAEKLSHNKNLKLSRCLMHTNLHIRLFCILILIWIIRLIGS